MNTYLNEVRTYCHNLEKSGKITPIKLDYPSFTITENGFRKSVLEYVTDRVRIGLATSAYGNLKFNDNITYENLLITQEKVSNNTYAPEDVGHKMFLEKLLPVAINRDENLDFKEINRNAVKEACVNNMQNTLLELDYLRLTSIPFERDNQSAYVVMKAKYAATMIMLKEQIPNAYKGINLAMNTAPTQSLINELRNLEQDPDVSVIQQIKNIDPKFAMEKFPKQTRFLEESSKEVKFNI